MSISDLVEAITTKDRHFLSLFLAMKKLMENKCYDDVEGILEDTIRVQRQNLKEWSR